MRCRNCHEGEMKPAQVARVSEGLGVIGYTVTFCTVLTLGAGVGWGLAVMDDGGLDLSWALIVTPVVLIACTPIVIIGALRLFSEKEVWRCTNCNYVLDRA